MIAEAREFRVRDQWVEAALREAREVADSGESEREAHAVLEAATEAATSLRTIWGRFLSRLEQTGVPGDELVVIASLVVAATGKAQEAIQSLRDVCQQHGLPGDEDDLMAALRRIERQACSLLESAKAPPPAIDPLRLQESLAQTERGEGEDIAEAIARVRNGGSL
jgi:hypothetical protein